MTSLLKTREISKKTVEPYEIKTSSVASYKIKQGADKTNSFFTERVLYAGKDSTSSITTNDFIFTKRSQHQRKKKQVRNMANAEVTGMNYAANNGTSNACLCATCKKRQLEVYQQQQWKIKQAKISNNALFYYQQHQQMINEETMVVKPTSESKYINYYELFHDRNKACSSSTQNLELKPFPFPPIKTTAHFHMQSMELMRKKN